MRLLMKNRVFWRGIDADIAEHIALCEHCQLGKATPNKREGLMQLFPVNNPFEMVHMDIVGPLPVTKSGNRYILTMMDRYSRMVKLVALPVCDASAIATAFRNHWLLEYGIPVHVLTDRGSYFTGLIFDIVSKIFGFKCLFTTSYHPKTNGRLERFHRYLKQRLRVLAHQLGLDFLSSDDWDIYLPNIAFSYNITPSAINNYAPYSIIYDNWIKLPIDRILNTDIDGVISNSIEKYKNPMDARVRPIKVNAKHRAFITTLRKHREHLQSELLQSRIKYDNKRKEYYDKHRVPATKYTIGQDIFVDISVGKVGNAAKLGVNRKHAIIMDPIGDNSYTVKFDDGKLSAVNVERIYTVSKSNIKAKPKRGRNAHKNYKRRAKKRKLRDSINNNDGNITMDNINHNASSKRRRTSQNF